jgi:THO complex subunit 2
MLQPERGSKRTSRKESHRDERSRRPPEKEDRERDSERKRKERDGHESDSRGSIPNKVCDFTRGLPILTDAS